METRAVSLKKKKGRRTCVRMWRHAGVQWHEFVGWSRSLTFSSVVDGAEFQAKYNLLRVPEVIRPYADRSGYTVRAQGLHAMFMRSYPFDAIDNALFVSSIHGMEDYMLVVIRLVIAECRGVNAARKSSDDGTHASCQCYPALCERAFVNDDFNAQCSHEPLQSSVPVFVQSKGYGSVVRFQPL